MRSLGISVALFVRVIFLQITLRVSLIGFIQSNVLRFMLNQKLNRFAGIWFNLK